MTPLGAEIRRRIAAEGPISVHDYMALALHHPEHGYYRAGDRLGAGGDFVTAPEISQMFGELIGLWAADAWTKLGRPAPLRLVELGPGRGSLIEDALRALSKVAPSFRDGLSLHLVESSRTLRQRQARTLAKVASPAWHDKFADVPGGVTIVIANEFFDALPIRQLVRVANGWRERVIDYDDAAGIFVFADGPPATPPGPHAATDAPQGAVVEFCHEGIALAGEIASRIAAVGGAALIVDYGHAAAGFGDTLQAVRRHKFADPLVDPGESDLTAHVDFAALFAAARAAGAAVFGPVAQGTFLRRLGIGARANALLAQATHQQAEQIVAATRRLIDRDGMGTLFKALAIVRQSAGVPAGFDPAPSSNSEHA